MTKERAEKVADYLSGLFWCFTRSRMTRDQVDHLAALLADEPNIAQPVEAKPPKPRRWVFEETGEERESRGSEYWLTLYGLAEAVEINYGCSIKRHRILRLVERPEE